MPSQMCCKLVVLAWLALAQFASADLYNHAKHVVSFTDEKDFESTVVNSDSVWMIQFYSSEDSKSQRVLPDYLQVAEIARGIYSLGVVDVTTDAGQALAKTYGVKTTSTSLPSFWTFADAPKPKKFTGKTSTAQDLLNEIIQTAMDTIRVRATGTNAGAGGGGGSSSKGPSKVVHLTASNFQEQVFDNPLVSAIAFTAPWCGHCKALLPDWEEAAQQLNGEGAFLGWVDATAETQLGAMFQVQGYPTIKLFPGGIGKSPKDAMDYAGGRSAPDIVRAVLAEVDRSGVPKPIPELTSEQVLQDHCTGQNHICVLAALPHILDSGAEGRKAYQETFAKVAKSFRGSAFSFLWFEGTSQPDLEQVLDLTFGFPAVAAFSMDKEAFVVMRTSFNEKNVAAFLHGVTSGRQRTAKVSSMPKVVTTVPWDGNDAAPIEEDIPLCEIMGTCDDEEAKENTGNGEL